MPMIDESVAVLKAVTLAPGDMVAAERLERHGLSHTLYLGLGFVENKFGLIYDDDFGYESARRIVPDIVFFSPEYFQLMWKLYLSRIAEDPVEVARIYWQKALQLLAVPTLLAQGLTVTGFVGVGLMAQRRLGQQLKQIVRSTPNTFADPICALAYSDALGPTKGGLRFHADSNLREVMALALSARVCTAIWEAISP